MFYKRLLSVVLMLILMFSACSLNLFSVSAQTDYEKYAKNLEKTTYKGELGAIYSKKSTTFKVWAPNSDDVKVRLYSKGSADEGSSEPKKEVSMKKDKQTGVWSVEIKGDLKNNYYTYFITRNGETVETSDIYAKACGVNGDRSMVVDLNSTDPDGWSNDKRVMVNNSTEAKIWEIQIADFSSSDTSGVSTENRGKYLAFTESGTTVNSISGSASTCVDYLKELGINYVHINPFYDFGSVDETDTSGSDDTYNWGYDPVNYNVPEGSYSSNPYDGNVRIKECKQMIQALHSSGVGVIMDVVYNHTQKGEDSNFNKTVPNYYYRINPDGTWSNGSGCGNDTASEREMYSKYMVDSVLYWAKEYHIDGFRFDLMGLHDVETMNKIRAELDKLPQGKKILMYGEPWDLSTTCDTDCVLSNINNVSKLNSRIAVFNDKYRDAVKGSTSGNDQGYLQCGSDRSTLKSGILAHTDEIMGFTDYTTQCVTYVSCHDNLTLWDKLVLSVEGSDANYYTRYNNLVDMNKLAGALTLTSQGISFLLAGEEFARTKQGDHNSYSSGFSVNQIDWTYLETYGDLVAYYKGLIEIRNNISAFTDSTIKSAQAIEFVTDVPDGVIAYTVPDKKFGKVFVAFNSSNEIVELSAKGSWVQLANSQVAGMECLAEISNKVEVPPMSATILVNKSKYNSAKLDNSKGKVIVRYFENDQIIKSYVVEGKVGDEFTITPPVSITLDYKIKQQEGNKSTFSDTPSYCDFYCEKLDDNTTNVIFRFLDADTGKNICQSVVLTNQKGETYETPLIPAVDGYTLNLKMLPNNGCGNFSFEDITVDYYYNKKSDQQSKVSVVYMAVDGVILGTDVLTGDINAPYSSRAKEFDGYEYVKSIGSPTGDFKLTDQNVLYVYSPTSNLYLILLISFVIMAILLITIVIVYIHKRKRKSLMNNLDIS